MNRVLRSATEVFSGVDGDSNRLLEQCHEIAEAEYGGREDLVDDLFPPSSSSTSSSPWIPAPTTTTTSSFSIPRESEELGEVPRVYADESDAEPIGWNEDDDLMLMEEEEEETEDDAEDLDDREDDLAGPDLVDLMARFYRIKDDDDDEDGGNEDDDVNDGMDDNASALTDDSDDSRDSQQTLSEIDENPLRVEPRSDVGGGVWTQFDVDRELNRELDRESESETRFDDDDPL